MRGEHRVVGGHAAIELGVTSEQRRQEGGTNVSTGGVKFHAPIVPDGWTKEQAVHTILQTHYWGLDELKQRNEHAGVTRDVLWEGLDSDLITRGFFSGEGNIRDYTLPGRRGPATTSQPPRNAAKRSGRVSSTHSPLRRR